MIKDVSNVRVFSMFEVENRIVYTIPRYQREYTWGKSEWDAFFDDLMESEPGYFLGSIICIDQPSKTFGPSFLELVDGQQRVTTISVLLAVLYQRLSEIVDSSDDELRLELMTLKYRLVLKGNKNQPRLVPQIQNNNQQDYFALLQQANLLEDIETVPHAGNRRLFKAFRHFSSRLSSLKQGVATDTSTLMSVLEKVINATMVIIEVASHADAYTLFESLNNRGVPLTAVDLIKNKVLAELERKDTGNIDKHYNRWKKIIDALGDDYSVQERFFRQYYNAFKSELKSVVSVPVATKSNLMHLYERLIAHDAEKFLGEMIRMSEHYAQIVGYRPVPDQPELSTLLLSLDRIQGAAAYLLLMVLFERKDILQLDSAHLEQTVEFLIAFFVRRNTTDLPPTRDLTRIFMDVAESILKLEGADVVKHIQTKLKAESASDEQFEKSLKGPIYEDNKAVCRFVLCALEESRMTRENQVDLWAKNKQYIWTIEHIFPQGENIPASWVKMIANGDAELAEEYRQTYVHSLGNLTISGYNSTLGNKSFEEKKNRMDSQDRKVGYNNGLYLNESLAGEDTWSVEKIKSRTTKLVKEVMGKYPLLPLTTDD